MPRVKVDMYESAEEAALRHPEYHQDFYTFLCEVVMTAQDIAYADSATIRSFCDGNDDLLGGKNPR